MIYKISLLAIISFSLLSLTIVPNVFGAESITLYSCTPYESEFYELDPTSGSTISTTEVVMIDGGASSGAGGSAHGINKQHGASFQGCTWLTTDPTDGQMYMISYPSDRFLVTLDPLTGLSQSIGWMDFAVDELDDDFFSNMIAIDGDGQMYATAGQSEGFDTDGYYKVDKATGIVDYIPSCSNTFPSSFNYLAFNHDEDQMYAFNGHSSGDHWMYEFDPTESDCQGSVPIQLQGGAVPPIPTPMEYSLGFTYDTITSKFLLMNDDASDQELFSIDATTGTIVDLGDTDNSVQQRGIAYSLTTNARPVITLTGASTVLVVLDGTYNEQGATCLDDEDGVISSVDIDASAIDTGTIGIYEVVYECTDSVPQTAQEIRTVEVTAVPNVAFWHVDIICLTSQLFDFSSIIDFLDICPIEGVGTDPEITLIGDAVIQFVVGDTYTELGAFAIDTDDGDITGSIVTTDDVDTSVAGVYFVNYDVQDSNGNDAVTKIRTIIVASAGGGTGGGSGSGSGVSQTGGTISGSSGTGDGDGSDGTDIDDLTESQIEELLEQLAPSQETTIITQIFQTFFEFRVLDNTHEDLVINSFLSDQSLGIQWTSGDDIIISSIRPAMSPFDFTFESVPNIKVGSGSAFSENSLIYNLDVPDVECSVEFSFDCVEKIRYSVPITVSAIINGTNVEATGNILVDLTEDQINPIILILLGTIAIPIIAGVVHHARGGGTPTRIKDLIH